MMIFVEDLDDLRMCSNIDACQVMTDYDNYHHMMIVERVCQYILLWLSLSSEIGECG